MGFVVSEEEGKVHSEGKSETASHVAEFWAAHGNLNDTHAWVLFSSYYIFFKNILCKFFANIESLEYL